MNRLRQELRRLYLHPLAGEDSAAPQDAQLLGDDGHTRALVLELARPADWRVLSAAWAGVQADLGLPAPAIAVTGSDGFQLWFSLVQPVLLAQAQAFLQALQQHYLPAVDPGRITLWPQAVMPAGGAPLHARLVPAEQGGSGLWSAFVAPDLAAVMNDEPWLDLPPNADGQAALLAGLRSMQTADLYKALQALQPEAEALPGAAQRPPSPASGPALTPALTSAIAPAMALALLPAAAPSAATAVASAHASDARAFLHGVMNDAGAPLALRVEAAKALIGQQP